jgi:hypothetical protein
MSRTLILTFSCVATLCAGHGAAAQTPPRYQPGDTVLLEAGTPRQRPMRVVIEAIVGDSADVRIAGFYSGVVPRRPTFVDTLEIGGLLIPPASIDRANISGARSGRVPTAALLPLSFTRPRPSPLRSALIASTVGGALGAIAGAMCECNAVGRGAARGAGLFTGLVLLAYIR